MKQVGIDFRNPLLVLILHLSLCGLHSQTVAVTFSTRDLTGAAARRAVTVTPQTATLLQTDGTNVVTGGPLVLAAAWSVTTNLWVGGYNVTIQGIPKTWPIMVTTNFGPGPVPAVWFTTNLVWPGTNFTVNVAQLVAGSNVILSPSNGMGRVTVSALVPPLPAGLITNGQSGVTLDGTITTAEQLVDSPSLTWYSGGVSLESGPDPNSVWITGELLAGVNPFGGYALSLSNGNVTAQGTVSAPGFAGSGLQLTNVHADTAASAATAGFATSAAAAAFATYAAWATNAGSAASVGWAALPGPVLTNAGAFDPSGAALAATNSLATAWLRNAPWTGSRSMLLAATAAGEYQMLNIQYNANLTPTNALVLWPDGTYGTWNATNLNPVWFTADGYTVSYTNTGTVIAQPTVLRDQNGNVTNAPALVIFP